MLVEGNKGELKNPGEICQFRWWFKNLNFTLKILINYYFTPNVSNMPEKNMTRVEGRLTSFLEASKTHRGEGWSGAGWVLRRERLAFWKKA